MLSRTRLLLGEEAVDALGQRTVTVVGLGGVGGYVAEALARSGVGRLHLVDADVVVKSNLNRQLFATKETLGMKKTEAARRRIEAVSDCIVTVRDVFVTEETVEEAMIPCDYLVDAIDSLCGKLALLRWADAHGIPMLACMGAGNRTGTDFRVIDLQRTEGCPLARRYRQSARRMGILHVPCVMSTEQAKKSDGTEIGSLAPTVGSAGLTAAAYVIQHLTEKGKEQKHGCKETV